MPLMLLRVEENEKTLVRSNNNKKKDSGRQKKATGVAFNVLKIVIDKRKNRKCVSHLRSARNKIY